MPASTTLTMMKAEHGSLAGILTEKWHFLQAVRYGRHCERKVNGEYFSKRLIKDRQCCIGRIYFFENLYQGVSEKAFFDMRVSGKAFSDTLRKRNESENGTEWNWRDCPILPYMKNWWDCFCGNRKPSAFHAWWCSRNTWGFIVKLSIGIKKEAW